LNGFDGAAQAESTLHAVIRSLGTEVLHDVASVRMAHALLLFAGFVVLGWVLASWEGWVERSG